VSAIAGVFFPDGRPVDRVDLSRMVEILAHRGPDGYGAWCEGPVGLVHRMLWTTPESLEEKQPLANQTGSRVITADARIDNRAELIRSLELADRHAAEVSDSQVILTAYEKWGEHCPEHLLGDFSFAIWDARRQALFCARDHFGMKPFFYYHKPGSLFAFGSEIKAILCLPEVPRRLDELRVGYHLAQILEDKVLTFFRDIVRLPPAHTATVYPDGIRLRQYWSLDPERELCLGSDAEYAQEFLTLFADAVRCRLRSAFPVGSMLSGGLDSSAVTCVAREQLNQNGSTPLHCMSVIYDRVPECDERPYIEAVLARSNLEPHYLHVEQKSPLEDWELIFWHEDETYASPTLYMHWALCDAAQKQGIRVLLDGLDGDTAVSHGSAYLAELARAGRWDEFSAEAGAITQHENYLPLAYLLQAYGFPFLSELATSGRWITFARAAGEISRRFNVPRRYLLRNYGIKPITPAPVLNAWRRMRGRNQPDQHANPILNQAFARRIGLDEQIEAVAGHRSVPPRNAREEHHRMLTSGLLPHTFEMADTGAAAFSIEARHPFYDRRLVEFCLALPPEQKLHQGWNRIIARRALDSVLPKQVQWRGGKASNSTAFTRALLSFEAKRLEEIVTDIPDPIAPYVDANVLRKTYRRYLSRGKSSRDEMTIWQTMTLALWLEHTGLTA
jgi:asparagine synthase (glutamine-hydrolysing)